LSQQSILSDSAIKLFFGSKTGFLTPGEMASAIDCVQHRFSTEPRQSVASSTSPARDFRRERPAAHCGLLPLVAGFGLILVLRNWMAAQQWDSTPIICVAIILSIYLMESAPSMALRPDVGPNVLLGWSFIFVVCSLLLAAFFQINVSERDTLVRLVEDHTAHNDVILVGPPIGALPSSRRGAD
jgi:hypothetical protein